MLFFLVGNQGVVIFVLVATVFTDKHLVAVLVDVASHRRVILEFCATDVAPETHDSIMGEHVLPPISTIFQFSFTAFSWTFHGVLQGQLFAQLSGF
jgi:hypothetical protein